MLRLEDRVSSEGRKRFFAKNALPDIAETSRKGPYILRKFCACVVLAQRAPAILRARYKMIINLRWSRLLCMKNTVCKLASVPASILIYPFKILGN